MQHQANPSAKELNEIIEKNVSSGWAQIVQKYGEEFIFQNNLIVANPMIVHQLFFNRNHTKKRSKGYKFMAWLIPGAPGILFQDGDIWQERIKQVMPVFIKTNISKYHQDLFENAKRNAEQWKARGTTDDLYLDVTNLGVENLLNLGYGLDPNDSLSAEYGEALINYKLDTMYESHRVDKLGFNIHNLKEGILFIKSLFRLKGKMVHQRKLLSNIIEKNKYSKETLNWINIFQSVKMPLRKMTDELNHIYGAFNAIDYVLTCALYALNAFPKNCAAALSQLKNTTFEDLEKSVNPKKDFAEIYVFMQEVYRFYPVACAVLRQTGEELEAAGKTWPKGTEVFIFLQAMHFSPEYWDVPNEFNPARFKTPLKEPKAYIPFLAGHRRCIGQHLAESHFIYSLLAIVQIGLPKISIEKFAIQPYLIPRLVNKLPAAF